MTTSDCARLEVLLESIQTSVRAIAAGQVALIERLDHLELRFDRLECRIDQVAIQITAIDAKVANIDAKLEIFSADTRSRFESIETHLTLHGAPRLRRRPSRSSAQRRKAS